MTSVLFWEQRCMAGLYLQPVTHRVHACKIGQARGKKGDQGKTSRGPCPRVHQTKSGRSMLRPKADLDWDMCLKMSDICDHACFKWNSPSKCLSLDPATYHYTNHKNDKCAFLPIIKDCHFSRFLKINNIRFQRMCICSRAWCGHSRQGLPCADSSTKCFFSSIFHGSMQITELFFNNLSTTTKLQIW
jgi:hypothetical protein